MDRSYWDRLIVDLGEYIQDETRDAQYYLILAEQASTLLGRELILEFVRDETRHAAGFEEVYHTLTGRTYEDQPMAWLAVPPFKEAVKQRVIAETRDYRKYGEQYLRAPDSYLRDLFYLTRTDEAIHAMRLQILFPEEAG